MKYPVNWLILAGFTAVVLYFVSPVLPPFVVAAFFAWLLDPLVRRLVVRGKWPRWLAVGLVFILFVMALTTLLCLAVPRISTELVRLVHVLPSYVRFIRAQLPESVALMIPTDMEGLRDALAVNGLDGLKAGSILAPAVKTVFHSGAKLAVWMGNLILVPVVALYLLYDWDQVLAGVRRLLPRQHASTLLALAGQCDAVLAAFFRGQFLVMLTLGVIYSVGLTLLGLQTGLLIGIMIGVLAIIPYLGVIMGLTFACIAAWVQVGSWTAALPILIFFAVVQSLDSMFITPRLVGHRIGLHPVLVILAVLAGGSIAGFTGVLVALPVAAMLRVLFDFCTRRECTG